MPERNALQTPQLLDSGKGREMQIWDEKFTYSKIHRRIDWKSM